MDDERKRPLDGLGKRARDAWSGRARPAGEELRWHLRGRLLWPLEDWLDALGTRGQIGVFGGGGVALCALVAALIVALGGGSGPAAGTTEALVTRPAPPAARTVAPVAKPKKKPAKPSGPALHGAPPDFSPATGVKAAVGSGKALKSDAARSAGGATGAAPAARGSAAPQRAAAHTGAAANGSPASTARIGSTPAASAAAQAQASSFADHGNAGVGIAENEAGESAGLTGPPAPKAAKRTARRFAEAFVAYEVGGVDGQVRAGFRQTSTKQLSRALLHRPPRQPAGVKVPKAMVVNVVAAPSSHGVFPVSVSLLRVGVTSELRLELERGVGKKWQVTNVLG